MPSPSLPNQPTDPVALHRAIEGCLLGTAVGDTVGLPFEQLSRDSVSRLMQLPLEQDLVLGFGLPSDDTEHTVMLALSLLDAGPNVAKFKAHLGRRMRWWLLAAPPSVGAATARAVVKLWFNTKSAQCGVNSAGNGPAMRAALLGLVWSDEPARLRDFVWASSRMTHTDPRAVEAALAVAVAAGCAMQLGPATPTELLQTFTQRYNEVSNNPSVLAPGLELLSRAVADNISVPEFAARLGCEQGVTGFSLHTVPVALYAWMRHSGSFREAVTVVIQCGGDTNSTAAITGAILGTSVGPEGIPATWLGHIAEWPRSVSWMRELATKLAHATTQGRWKPPTKLSRLVDVAALPWMLLRNAAMAVAVLYVFARRTSGLLLSRLLSR